MKVVILSLTVLLSGCVGNLTDNSSTEYYPFGANPPPNCFVADSNIVVVNGIPSFEYICNKK